MSMYGMLFGKNPASSILLATLDLTEEDVGRFRDCYVTDGKIVVYTRNGGGNRNCWCESMPEYGTEKCKHRVEKKMVDEWVQMPEAQAVATGKPLGTHYIGIDGTDRDVKTGNQVEKTYYVCLNPNSPDCHCIGCFMTYHVKNLPYYSHDRDDDFDCTYATIYFNFPPEYAEGLKALDSGEQWDPDERWMKMIDSIEERLEKASTS